MSGLRGAFRGYHGVMNQTDASLRLLDLVPIEGLDQLDPTGCAQLEKAGKLYSGQDLTAAQILAGGDEDGEGINPQFLERGRVVDASGEHLYDAWLYMVDSGTIFARGTTRVVAEVIQMGVECDDEALEKDLSAALDNRPERAPRQTAAGGALAAYEAAVKGTQFK